MSGQAPGVVRVVVVTGTDTDVGKTVVTAALCARLLADGQRVHLHKPTQTGVAADEEGDVQTVRRMLGAPVGLTTSEGVRLPEPLAPATAARRAGVEAPTVARHAEQVRELARALARETAGATLVLEGAGGVLVEMDAAGGTLRDLVRELATGTPDHEGGGDALSVQVVVVARAGLGTLNHAALTVEALRGPLGERLPARTLAGLVVGASSEDPGLAERCNVEDLPRVTGLPLLGSVPAGAGDLSPEDLVAGAARWLVWP
ncbi:dethiobiotin synthase [Kytococcus schroeteri]|uniref:ATP-dependent dethiobiotin synthetase BioD n=2 Tax=Kytococcus TaxID=57499 RepID=A0A2I1P9K5_9MICO|nr:dethiobiotin synthase [Kytococcus schroeteri]PKZ41315.1 dethiobiotin synthase [Kytococcus schroeteri]